MADIKKELENIKNALLGRDVRDSIHDGIDAINKEVENTTGRQVDLENTFDQLVINAGNSNAEIVDARAKSDGTSYSKLGDRLDGIDSQLAQNATSIERNATEIEGVISYIENDAENSIGDLTLGIQDGLLYLFNAGSPQGIGIEMLAQEVAGDVVGYIGDNNEIVLSGSLAAGVYTIKYEMEDGTIIDIGKLSFGAIYTNQIPLSVDADGSPYNGGQGWKTGYRISISSGTEREQADYECTGFIKVNSNTSVIRLKNIEVVDGDTTASIVGYDANFTKLEGNGVALYTMVDSTDENGVVTLKQLKNATHLGYSTIKYIRFCSPRIDDNSIVTVDEEIVE